VKDVGGCLLFALRECALASVFFASVPLMSCSAHSGRDLVPGEAGRVAAVDALSKRSASGDRGAQYELAVRFEEGRGVPVDTRRAIALYTLFLTAGETRLIYLPSAGGQSKSSVLPVQDVQFLRHSKDAQRRLARLKAMTAVAGE
jgi:TPR repeat protein